MKTFAKLLSGIIICMILTGSCQKEKISNLKGSVVFKVQTTNAKSLKSAKSETEPVAANLIVTIEKSGGDVVYDREKLLLTNLNGSYLSKGLPLPPGSYNLTEFLVTDANDQVIYITPKAGSNAAYLVSNPLPINFQSNPGQESIIIPDVIRTDSSALGDFGYAGFSFNKLNTFTFLISVYTKDPGGNNLKGLDSCNLLISNFNNMYLGFNTFTLGAANAVNPIYLKRDSIIYLLYVSKPGYSSWADTLTLSQLERYSTTPLHVFLKPLGPCIWFGGEFWADYDDGFFNTANISVSPSDNLFIDFGTGLSEKMAPNTNHAGQGYFGPNLVQIYGDVSRIKTLGFACGRLNQTSISANFDAADSLEELSAYYITIGVNLSHLQLLKTVDYNTGVGSLNFTNCTSLETINLHYGDHFYFGTEDINIQTNDNLKTINFEGFNNVLFGKNPSLTTINISYNFLHPYYDENLNSLVLGLLGSVSSSPRSGSLVMGQPWFIYPSTETAQEALDTLVLKYNWNVTPFYNLP